MSRPVPRLGVGSRISWVIFLSKIRDPTQPLVFSPSRDCRGSFLPLVKKDPHHRRGSFFRSRRDLFPGSAAAINKVSGPDFEPPTSCAFLVPSSLCGDRALRFSPVPLDFGPWTPRSGESSTLDFPPWSTISVVNYLLKVGDHTTPPWDDISLTNFGPAAPASARSDTGAHRGSRPWTLDLDPDKVPIFIQP